MTPYFLLFVVVLLAVLGIGWWAWRIARAYRTGRKGSALVQAGLLAAIILPILWVLEILPPSRNLRFQKQAETLTGKSFWGWKKYSIDEASVRGEGYWLEAFTFNEQMAKYFAAPDEALFAHRPTEWMSERNFSGWKRCPVDTADMDYLEHAALHFGGWGQEKIEWVDRVKAWGKTAGNLYAFGGDQTSLDFFVINPKERTMVLIYDNP
jgi:hypothetical protein